MMGMAELVRQETPEERELGRKRAELAALEGELAERELILATLKGELVAFEKKYLRTVGRKYVELDEVCAKMYEAEARLVPADEPAQQRAEEGRRQAEESARVVKKEVNEGDDAKDEGFDPTDVLKKLYRDLAKTVHPDLAEEEKDRARRHQFMIRANEAYERSDENALRAILREWQDSPEFIRGEGVVAELVRMIRTIARAEAHIGVIDDKIAEAKRSDLYRLKLKTAEAEAEGRDLLGEMSGKLEDEIAEVRKRLSS
jgi:hypothetical protein